MESMVPAVVEKPRKWIASQSGEITKYEPKRVVRLSGAQQHTAMRYALAHAHRMLVEHGGRALSEFSTISTTISFRGIDFDISIREPGRIAYVTSKRGDDRVRRKIGEDICGKAIYEAGPGVRFGSDDIRSEYVVQIIGSKISSAMPLYIECPPDERDPVGYVLRNILQVLASFLNDDALKAQANLDTSTMTQGKLPDYLMDELSDAVTEKF